MGKPKAAKKESKSEKSALKSLLQKNLLIPLSLGVLVTGVIAGGIIYYKAPQWVSEVQDESIIKQGDNLKSLAQSSAMIVGGMFQKISDELLVIDRLMQDSEHGQIQLGNVPPQDPSYYVNAKALANNQQGIMNTIPDYDFAKNISYARSMWMAIGPKASMDPINLGHWNNVPQDYQTFYNNWLPVVPYAYSIFDGDFITKIYAPFAKANGTAIGLFIEYPLLAQYDVYVEFKSPRGSENFFSFATRPWYQQTISKGVLHSIEFIYPYRFTGTQEYGYSACVMTVSKGMVCMDYEPTYLEDYIESVGNSRDISFFVIEIPTYRVIIFPDKSSLSDSMVNITQVEYKMVSLSGDAVDYDINLIDLVESYNAETNYLMSYTKDDAEYILTIQKIEIYISKDPSVAPKEYVIGLNMPKDFIVAGFEDLKEDMLQSIFLVNGILIGLVLLFILCSPILVSWVALAIAGPIDNLKKILLQISGEYMEDEDDPNDKKNKKGFIYRILPEIDALSQEMDSIHTRFTTVQSGLRFARNAELASTDAEAIINYAQALAVYRDLKNLRGIGIISFNLGNIHFKHERYEEALSYYKESIHASHKELENLKDIENRLKRNNASIKSVAKILNRTKNDQGLSTDIFIKVSEEVEESHCARTYQLAQCLLAIDKKTKKLEIDFATNQHIRSLLFETLTTDSHKKRNPYRVILCLLDIADTYLDIEHYDEAKKTIKEANEKLRVYEDEYIGFDDENSKDYKIPPANLRQKALYLMGKLGLAQGRKKEACVLFTKAIEHGETYDPAVRKLCLQSLKDIFRQQGLTSKAPNVEKMLTLLNNKRKDIVILLDYSQSMLEGKKINFAITNLLRLFDKFVKAEDRISFIRFNMNCDIIFTLVEKSKNTSFLRKTIEESTRPNGGTALFNAINEGLKVFIKAEPRHSNKWIIAITDGDDNDSRITYEQIYKKLLRTPDINLIIIGLGLQPSVKKKLGYLCKSTTDGLFLDSPTQEDLNVAFQAMSNIVFGFEVNVSNEKINF